MSDEVVGVRRVSIEFKLVQPDGTVFHNPSFPFYVRSLADVPLVGDELLMHSGTSEGGSMLVRVGGRGIRMIAAPKDGRFTNETPIEYAVTLGVTPISNESAPKRSS